MKEVTCATSFSLRRNDLHRQIVEASRLKDQSRFALLEIQWAHRYGLQSFPETSQQESSFQHETLLGSGLLETQPAFLDVLDQEQESLDDNSQLISNNNKEENGSESYFQRTSIEELKSLTYDTSEELDNHLEDDLSELSNHKGEKSPAKKFIQASLPPRPFVNHLRRWLPNLEDELPKAS